MLPLRSRGQLFALAETRALGAEGYGFAIANQMETRRYGGGGSKLANLPSAVDEERAAARVVTLTDGWVHLGTLDDERFTVSLFVVSPAGGYDLLSFYCGPSGLALGSEQPAFEPGVRARGAAIARALAAALEAVAPTYGPRPWRNTPDAFTQALSSELDPLARISALNAAWLDGVPESTEVERAYRRAVAPLWEPALEVVEAAQRADAELPHAVDVAAPVIAFPPTTAIRDSLGQARLTAVWERDRERMARLLAAHPWS